MNIHIFLTATIFLCLVGCNNDVPTANQVNQTSAAASIKQQAGANKEFKRQKRVCEKRHIGNIKNKIKKASKKGETGVTISTYYCEIPFTRHGGCYSGFSCEAETHTLITTLKDKGYKVVEVDEDSNSYDDQYDTHYVSWFGK